MSNPDICKIVITAQFPDDNLNIHSFLQSNRSSAPIVSFAVGRPAYGHWLLAPFYGAAFTYASLGRGLETAPRQPSVSELRSIYEMLGLE